MTGIDWSALWWLVPIGVYFAAMRRQHKAISG